MTFRAALCGIIIGGSVFIGSQSFGQTNSAQSGNWSDPLTWSAGEPTGTVPAIINGGHTVTIDSSGETTNLLDVGTVSGQTGNLNITGGDLFIDDADTVTEPNIPSIRIGQAAGSTGHMTMSDGMVFINGANPSGFANGDLIVGDVGTGTFTMSGGDLEAVDEIIIGLADVSSGTATISGGTFRTSGRSILVGFDGIGTLNVSDTGSVFANFDLLVGFIEGGNGIVNQSGGTIEAGFLFTNSFSGGTGSSATVSMTGGTFNTRIAYVLGQGNGSTTANHSGGTINAMLGNGEFVVGDGPGNSSTYNISGTADVNILRNLVAGRDGIGVINMSGGTIDAENVFLGDFDSSSGTMKITGGTLNLTGSFNVGGALASNAAPDRVEPTGEACVGPNDPPGCGAQGQALDANGTLIVSGSAATISVGGNFRANPGDKSQFRSDPFIAGADNSSTLVFEIFNNGGTSLIDVAGVADLDGAVIDIDLMSGFTPTIGATFDLLEAASFGATGTGTTENVGFGDGFSLASEDAGAFSLAVVAGGGVETLVATFLGAAAQPGDYNDDGIVNAADYVAWRKNPSAFGGDPAGYNTWRANFAEGGSGGGQGAVPEPTAFVLALLTVGLGLIASNRNR
jgi:T5SS/PEP-CTERM-associated repeat protein